ncbi:hypothetical protein DSO57_1032951 [Entomophthora muscae]|uniref:Uncharacterized protein n=1 Tax=Entomophthora muscae TaxID=34485 RepID=A0ACC2SPM1_9FUNG|nr:hypothetical protein DSO57_1032951 [Entomophthora muscae]
MAYWWLVPPGWEPDFVSLAPSLTMPIILESPPPIPILQKDPVSPANGSTGLANDPKITGDTVAEELQKLPV